LRHEPGKYGRVMEVAQLIRRLYLNKGTTRGEKTKQGKALGKEHKKAKTTKLVGWEESNGEGRAGEWKG